MQDGSYGALEHNNSVTIGLPSKELAESISNDIGEIAHEYFHAWNMIRLHPAEFGDISYQKPALSKGLWWSEGLTMFYADLLLRRAGISPDTTSRIDHLAALIQRYYNSSGNYKFSAERVSMADNAPPGFLGDYDASTHLQGEILGNLLDFIIRDATNGRRTIDDLMRTMFYHFSGAKGFTGKDIEQKTKIICNCNVHAFFENYIRGNQAIGFNKYLNLIGLKMNVSRGEALTDDKKAEPDTRIYAWKDPISESVKLGLTDPQSCWGNAMLHTGDIIKKINDTVIINTTDFYKWRSKLKVGDTVNIKIERNQKIINTRVVVSGYKQPVVQITQLPTLSEKQQRLKTEWLLGEN